MPTMKAVQTAGPGAIDVVEAERPVPGPRDVLIRVRACGTCGTDATFVHLGGLPAGPDGQTRPIPHGHEPAGEIIEAGAAVTGLKPGDRAGASPQAAPSAALRGGRANEPMAVARHCVNRAQADPADKAAVSGAGPIGPGVTTWLKLAGVTHAAVTDIIPAEIFEVTPQLAEHQHRFARLISHRIPFTDVHHAFQLALTPGAPEKIIVALGD